MIAQASTVRRYVTAETQTTAGYLPMTPHRPAAGAGPVPPTGPATHGRDADVPPNHIGSSLRVLALAVERGLIEELPEAVHVFPGGQLRSIEVEWLVRGLAARTVRPRTAAGLHEVRGTLLGRPVVVITADQDVIATAGGAR